MNINIHKREMSVTLTRRVTPPGSLLVTNGPHVCVYMMYISTDVQVMARDDNGDTCLCFVNSCQMLDILIAAGARLDIRNIDGKASSLHMQGLLRLLRVIIRVNIT